MTDVASASHGALVLLAVVTKLACSCDDVLWLTPFMTGSRADRARNAAVYLLCVCTVTGVAGLLSLGASAALEEALADSGWSSSTVLELVGGSVLLLYALKLAREAWLERAEAQAEAAAEAKAAELEVDCEAAIPCEEKATGEAAAEEAKPHGQPLDSSAVALEVDCEAATEAATESAAAEEENTDGRVDEVDCEAAAPVEEKATEAAAEEKSRWRQIQQLVIICWVGSIDDLAVQASLLVAGTFALWHLFAGVILGSLIVVALCLGATFLRPVVWVIERIPLWAIVAALATWSFVSALT